LLRGEIFMVEEEKNGWCKGRCAHDNYPGYIESKYLTKAVTPSTHVVTAAQSHVYQDPTMKSAKLETLGFGSLLAIVGEKEGWAKINGGGWIFQKHLTPTDKLEKDMIATAKKFLEVPYYWGGRSGFGIDCSGLMQACFARAGISIPRDTDVQEASVGNAAEKPQKGDIVFFPGHVGLMVDDQNIIHANAFHMKVTVEPLTVVAERSKKITAVKRGPFQASLSSTKRLDRPTNS
jgi:cell wall-associated NlpC family hydrolase